MTSIDMLLEELTVEVDPVAALLEDILEHGLDEDDDADIFEDPELLDALLEETALVEEDELLLELRAFLHGLGAAYKAGQTAGAEAEASYRKRSKAVAGVKKRAKRAVQRRRAARMGGTGWLASRRAKKRAAFKTGGARSYRIGKRVAAGTHRRSPAPPLPRRSKRAPLGISSSPRARQGGRSGVAPKAGRRGRGVASTVRTAMSKIRGGRTRPGMLARR